MSRKEQSIDHIMDMAIERTLRGLQSEERPKEKDKLEYYSAEFYRLFQAPLEQFWDNLGFDMPKFCLYLVRENQEYIDQRGGFCPAELVRDIYGLDCAELIEEICFGKMRHKRE